MKRFFGWVLVAVGVVHLLPVSLWALGYADIEGDRGYVCFVFAMVFSSAGIGLAHWD